MDSLSIELNGSEINAIELEQRTLRIQFSRALLTKTLTGSTDITRWWQVGCLTFDGVELQSPLPSAPVVCTGGELDDNLYTYRDMLPIPFESRGHLRCTLQFADAAAPLIATATAAQLVMQDTPKYIAHLR